MNVNFELASFVLLTSSSQLVTIGSYLKETPYLKLKETLHAQIDRKDLIVGNTDWTHPTDRLQNQLDKEEDGHDGQRNNNLNVLQDQRYTKAQDKEVTRQQVQWREKIKPLKNYRYKHL
jgi:hypothetical protein